MKERQRQLLATAQAGAQFWTARVGAGLERIALLKSEGNRGTSFSESKIKEPKSVLSGYELLMLSQST